MTQQLLTIQARCPECQEDFDVELHVLNPAMVPGGGVNVPVTTVTSHHCGEPSAHNLAEPPAPEPVLPTDD